MAKTAAAKNVIRSDGISKRYSLACPAKRAADNDLEVPHLLLPTTIAVDRYNSPGHCIAFDIAHFRLPPTLLSVTFDRLYRSADGSCLSV